MSLLSLSLTRRDNKRQGLHIFRIDTYSLLFWDNVITATLNTLTVITPTLNTSTVTDSLCNSGTFSNPNAVRDCPFNLKGAWFLSRSRKFFFACSAIVFKAFQCGPTKYFLQKKILFHVDLKKMLSPISLFLRSDAYGIGFVEETCTTRDQYCGCIATVSDRNCFTRIRSNSLGS